MSIEQMKHGVRQSDVDRLIASLPEEEKKKKKEEEILSNTSFADSNHRNKSYIDFIIVAICFDMLVKSYWTFSFNVDKSSNK
jgi:hypothetical protein